MFAVMARDVNFAPDEWYHCYSRGVDKRIIFSEPAEYERFQMLLYAANSQPPIQVSSIGKHSQGPTLGMLLDEVRGEPLVDIAAYALMPNHYHLLIRECTEGGITSFMRRIGTGYTMYFNLKHERTGALFSGKFKSRHVADTPYFRRAVAYIHGNPGELVEPEWKTGTLRNPDKVKSFLANYPYSSLPDYCTQTSTGIVATEVTHDILGASPTIEDILRDVGDFGDDRNI